MDSFKNYMGKITPKLSQESKVKREAYLSLAKVCLSQKNYNIIAPILENLKNYDGHWKYENTFNFLVNVLDRKGIYLFNCFDWKFGIEDFYKCISSIIETNFDFDIELAYQNDYSNNATISTENFFSEYRNQLNEKGFDSCFKEEDSDSYVVLICKKDDIEKALDSLSKLS